MSSSKGKLFLIPNTLGPAAYQSSLPPEVGNIINEIDVYIVENGKEARRLLKKLNIKKPLQELEFFELNKHTGPEMTEQFIEPLLKGKNTAVISDAGCPGVADPGAMIVELAHRHRITVVPMVGPSSILLGLMASGFNGQQFVFHGYLPKDRKMRISELKRIESASQKLDQTQIFIETPFRNDHLIEDIISNCQPSTRLCVAANLTLPNEKIISIEISDWKKNKLSFHKMPAVFLLYASRNYQ